MFVCYFAAAVSAVRPDSQASTSSPGLATAVQGLHPSHRARHSVGSSSSRFKQHDDHSKTAGDRDDRSHGRYVPYLCNLLALCLTVFPPSPAFGGHLEHWIRQPKNETYERRFRLKGLSRRRCYEGPDDDLPSVEAMASACTCVGRASAPHRAGMPVGGSQTAVMV